MVNPSIELSKINVKLKHVSEAGWPQGGLPPINVRSQVGHGWSKLVTDGQNLQFYHLILVKTQNTNFTPPIWS